VFDRLLIISGARQRAHAVSVHKGGSTLRNIVIWMPNVAGYASGALSFFDFDANNPATSPDNNALSPVAVYNCTGVSQQTAANETSGPIDLVAGEAAFSDTSGIGNNVMYAPSGSTPVTGDAPIDTTSTFAGVTSRMKGVQFNYEMLNQTMSSVPNGGTMSIPYSDLRIRDQNGSGSGAATNQAYWQSRDAGDVLHQIAIGTSGTFDTYRSADGDFTVTFGASTVVITNTSGSSWNGPEFLLRLDRKSLLDTDLPLQTQFATPDNVPTGQHQSGSAAEGSATGLTAHTDFLCDYRPATGVSRGAWQDAA
jgi:hypothetical protein